MGSEHREERETQTRSMRNRNGMDEKGGGKNGTTHDRPSGRVSTHSTHFLTNIAKEMLHRHTHTETDKHRHSHNNTHRHTHTPNKIKESARNSKPSCATTTTHYRSHNIPLNGHKTKKQHTQTDIHSKTHRLCFCVFFPPCCSKSGECLCCLCVWCVVQVER